MTEPIHIVPYNPAWTGQFQAVGSTLRHALQDTALRIDHIGSTSVPDLAAKPIIDIQVSVAALDPVDAYCAAMQSCGLVWRADNPERTKRYFREQPGTPRMHVHVRRAGSWGEQFALLFRDYLRCHAADAERYAQTKYRLADQYRYERQAYVDAKEPIIWEIISLANTWSQAVGWEPGPSDC